MQIYRATFFRSISELNGEWFNYFHGINDGFYFYVLFGQVGLIFRNRYAGVIKRQRFKIFIWPFSFILFLYISITQLIKDRVPYTVICTQIEFETLIKLL